MSWSARCPKEPGWYLLRCDENDRRAQQVSVFLREGQLWASDPDLGNQPVSILHAGLIDPSWCPVGK